MINISRVSLRSWTIAGLIVALSVLICYRWIDRPSAELVHNMVHPGGPLGPLFASLTRLPDLLTTIWFFLLTLLPVLAFATHAVRRSFDLSAVMLIAGSFVFASTVKMLLKVSFGRTWPETWIHDNPSLIRDGVYGFFPFSGGQSYSSFPSRHTTAICAVISLPAGVTAKSASVAGRMLDSVPPVESES